jgi:hypothetical protein
MEPDTPKPQPGTEEHMLPAEAVREIRPLQLQMAELRRQAKEAEMLLNASARMAMAMMGIDPANGYELHESGTKFVRIVKESKDE